MKHTNIEIKGHKGAFTVIDVDIINSKKVYLVESDIYGEDAPCIIIDSNNSILLDNVFNGFNDYIEYLDN